MRSSFKEALTDLLISFAVGALLGLGAWGLIRGSLPERPDLRPNAHDAYQQGYALGWRSGYADAENNASLVGSPDR